MSADKPTRSRHDLLVRHGGSFVVVSALVFDPPSSRGTVFCLHDFAGNAADFETMGGVLVGNGYRVVCIDLPGRGLSASMPAGSDYKPPLYVDVLTQVIQSLWSRRIFILGKGWGGLICLLLLQQVRFALAGVIVADVEPSWTVDDDPLLAELRTRQGRSIPTLDAAAALLRSSAEFEGASAETIGRFARSRFRQDASGLAPSYDPRIIAGLDWLRGRTLDLEGLFKSVGCPLLYLRGLPLEASHHAMLADPLARWGGAAFGGLSRSARVHFETAEELVALQGFLSTKRFVPPSPQPRQ